MKFTHLVIAGTAFVSLGAIAAGDAQLRGAAAPAQHHAHAGIQGDVVKQVQQRLNRAGFDAGPVDGIKGPQTRSGIKGFQQAQGLSATGELDQHTLAALGLDWAVDVGTIAAAPGTGAVGAAPAGIVSQSAPEMGPRGGPAAVPDVGEATAPGMAPAPTERAQAIGVTAGTAGGGVATPDRAPDVGEARAPGMAPAPTERIDASRPEVIRQAQQQLNAAGHEAGPVDGIKGPRTRQALREFQQARGLQVTGSLDQETLSALGITAVGATPGEPGAGVATPTTAPDVGEARAPDRATEPASAPRY
jgi:peptidoglycan hydrolase-like protein with peptidoglycan-binding domain